MNAPFIFSIVTTLCVVLLASCNCEAATRTVLVAVGSNRGLLDKEKPLTYASRDAVKISATLAQMGGVRASDIYLLHDNPSVEKVLRTLKNLAKSEHEDTVLIFFYSGHGDMYSLHIANEKLSLSVLYSALDAVSARAQLTFIDACRVLDAVEDNDTVKGGGPKLSPPFTIKATESLPSGTFRMYAAGPGGTTIESSFYQGGRFSHYLVTALMGGADANGDGQVSLGETHDFTWSNTRRDLIARGAAKDVLGPPRDIKIEGSGPLILTQTRLASAQLVVPSASANSRHALVKKGSGEPVVAWWGTPKGSRQFGIAAGQYILHANGPDGARHTEVVVPIGGRRSVNREDFRMVSGQEEQVDPQTRLLLSYSGRTPYPHRLGAGTGVVLADTDQRPGAMAIYASYFYGTDGWLPAASVWLSRRAYGTGDVLSRQTWQLSTGVQYRHLLKSFSLYGGFGATAALYNQEERRRDLGTPREQQNGSGVGPYVSFGFSFPLTGRFSSDLGVAGWSTVYRKKSDEGAVGSYSLVGKYGIETAMTVRLGFAVGL